MAVARWTRDGRLRLAGAALGGSLSAIAMTVGTWLLDDPWAILGPIDLPMLAIGVGTVVGLLGGPAAAAAPRPIGFTASVAAKVAVIVVTLGLGGAAVLGRLAGRPGFEAGQVLTAVLFIVPVAIVLGLAFTLPVAASATAALRVLAGRPRLGSGLVAIAVGAAILAGPALDGRRLVVDWSGSVGASPVRLAVTIANHSPDELVLGVWAREVDGSSGWSQGIGGCFVTTGTSDEAADWFVTLEPAASGDWEVPPPELVSAAEAPGPTPHLWIDVAPDGTMTVATDRALPTREQQTTSLCREAGR